MGVREAGQIFLDTDSELRDSLKNFPSWWFFDIEAEELVDDYRIVFWFDN